MGNDIFWEVFRDTGDPLCWLMTRPEGAAAGESTPRTNKKAPGEEPKRSSP